MFYKLYTFGSYLALNSTHLIIEAPNLSNTFVFMLVIIFLSWLTGDMVEVHSVHGRMSFSHMLILAINRTRTFGGFLALNSTHLTIEDPNYTMQSTFVFMLIMIFLSLVD